MPPKYRQLFANVESSNAKIFDHKNGAYGSFGFRKTGRLKDVYDQTPELKQKYGDYESFWNKFIKSGYNSPMSEHVHGIYENYLQRKFGDNIKAAAKYNFGSKANAYESPDTYAAKITGTKITPMKKKVQVTKKVEDPLGFTPKPNIMTDASRPLTDAGRKGMTALSYSTPKSRVKLPSMRRIVSDGKGGYTYENSPSSRRGVRLPNIGKASSILPFVSNVAGLFNKPPMPSLPVYMNPVQLKKINMDNDRYSIEQGIRGMNNFASNNFDSQGAMAALSFNNAQRFNQMSAVNQSERNQNTLIDNDQAKINNAAEYQNRLAVKGYQDSLIERKMAIQRDRQANLSNASDKFVMLQDINPKRKQAAMNMKFATANDYYGAWERRKGEFEEKRNGGIISNHTAGKMIKFMNFKRLN